MNVSEQKLRELIRKGEGLAVEFKTCRDQLSRDVYETVCAFLNRHGGTILLGVDDSGTIVGIDSGAVGQIKKDFVTAINNPQKLTPPTYLSIDQAELDQKQLLHIFVSESSQVHRCNGRIYDRNEDGDLDITDHTAEVARLYQRKQATYSENKVYPHIQVGDLRADLIEKCRRHVRINRKEHPWVDMDDLQLVRSSQLYQTDPESGRDGVTLAGVMLFGTDSQILQVCPAHRTDLILRKVNVNRYDDRDLVRTNLIDSYDRILAFIRKHLSDPFYLEGTDRKSLREAIFREVASNMLIHREYASGVPARLIIEYGKVTTYNANRPHGFGVLDPETSVPYPKNPVIGAFFREIDRADELGSGMRNMMQYGKRYGGADPELIEGDVFRMIISVPEFGEEATVEAEAQPRTHDGAKSGPELGPESGLELGPESIARRVLDSVAVKPLSKSELAHAVGHKSISGKLNIRIREMLSAGLVEYTVPDKPRSRNQKYRLTGKGRAWLENQVGPASPKPRPGLAFGEDRPTQEPEKSK